MFNPFFNYSVEQCDRAIAEIQERLEVGAKKVSHAGSGGMDLYDADTDIKNLQHLANRRAELLGEKLPGRAAIRAFIVNSRGYGHARRPV